MTTAPASRLLKATCAECGYTVRVTRKWANTARPQCPVHQQALAVEGLDEMPPPPAPPARPALSASNVGWWAQRWLDKAAPEEIAAMRDLLTTA